MNINSIDLGAAFLPQNQDPTRSRPPSRRCRVRRLRAGAAAADPRLREHRPAVAGVRRGPTTRCSSRRTAASATACRSAATTRSASATTAPRRAAAPAAQRRRVVRRSRRSGGVQRPDEEPGPAAPHRQGELRLGPARLARRPASTADRGGGRQRLAAVRHLHRRIGRAVRHHLPVPEQRREREPDRLAGLRGARRHQRRHGQRLQRTIASASSPPRRSRARCPAASASSRAATT